MTEQTADHQLFDKGDKILWLTHGYGWSKGKHIPGEVIEYSKSGQKVRIKFYLADWHTNERNGRSSWAWVYPHMLKKAA